ncbi:helix-turn-helix transcriptional regulator [Haloechinothrix salitolerans]|uniref:Helix-turn-helix domain-containing protein n=1 Tax=Haloechinothrix salitolerans TaxID=926830 RepID=A0ABW2BWG0_9PSEU
MLVSAPSVPPEFWQTDQMQDALAAWHIGRVIQAYRLHPWHGQPIPQGVVASWVGLTQTQLSRIENGPAVQDLAKLIQWARVLRIPPELLWFKLPGRPAARAEPATTSQQPALAAAAGESLEDDVNRRDVLRLLSLANTLLALPVTDEALDVDRLGHAATRPRHVDTCTLDEYARLNARLWQVFADAKAKRLALPMVRQQLEVLTTSLQQTHTSAVRRRLCELAADLFQLCGEIFFDSDRYTDAANCYSLAANTSKEAAAYDLWACAMTRQAYIGVYERQFDRAAPLLSGAATLAQKGDSGLSTRYWVAAVQAQTFAGLGQLSACQRALETAEQVTQLKGTVHTDGWLRFEGSRLAEERGSCFVELGRPELAEPALVQALSRTTSTRRRGSVLADLAMVGAQRGDSEQLVMYADAALDVARQTNSVGYLGRKLKTLKPQLKPFLADRHVRTLDRQITSLTTMSATNPNKE